MQRKRMFVLLACIVVASIGFGITLPVLPFYTERLVLRGRAAAADVAIQVALLTAVYPMLQFIFAPIWGYWCDRVGRKRLVLMGIGGSAVAQIFFGIATTLPLLYAARVLGGIVSSAIFPAAAAYIADSTTRDERSRGMAWLGTALSLGAVIGPALGAVLGRTAWELRAPSGAVIVSSFAVPFFAAGLLALGATVAALVWLPESGPIATNRDNPPIESQVKFAEHNRTGGPLRALLVLALAGQFGLALFESTFALYAKRMWRYGPAEVGAAFAACGLVMSVAQVGAAAILAGRVGELTQVAVGFGLVGASLAVLPNVRSVLAMLTSVGTLALGIALITPNIAALISTRGGARTGTAFGVQSSANSLGQVGGTLAGGALLAWRMEAPLLVAASLLIATGITVAWWSHHSPWTRVPSPK